MRLEKYLHVHEFIAFFSFSIGFLGQCMENLFMDQEFWLISLDQDSGIEISIQEEELNLMYKGFLMQEGKHEHTMLLEMLKNKYFII